MSDAQIQAVIFDNDGTLVDSENLSIAVLAEYVAEFGYEIELADAMTQWAGGELPKIFTKVESALGITLPEDHLDQFRTRQMAKLATDVEPIPGAAEMLEALSLPYCVASNAPLNKVGLCLDTTGLAKFFPEDRRFSAYQIEKWKPEPDLFLMAAEAIGIEPVHCAVLEDSLYGVEAGLNAGMHVFAFDPKSELELPDKVTRVCSLNQFVPMLGSEL